MSTSIDDFIFQKIIKKLFTPHVLANDRDKTGKLMDNCKRTLMLYGPVDYLTRTGSIT